MFFAHLHRHQSFVVGNDVGNDKPIAHPIWQA